MRYIPSVVPISAQNVTAMVLQDEMGRRLSKLRTMADWGTMLQEVVASKGNTLLRFVVARAQTEASL
jgi:hypothetical protein